MKSKIFIRINSDPISRAIMHDAGIDDGGLEILCGNEFRVSGKAFQQFEIRLHAKSRIRCGLGTRLIPKTIPVWIPLDCLTIL